MSNLTLPSNKYNNNIWSPLLIAVSISEWKGNTINICYITEKMLSKNSWLYINILMLLSTAIWPCYQNCKSIGDWWKCERLKQIIFDVMHLPKMSMISHCLYVCICMPRCTRESMWNHTHHLLTCVQVEYRLSLGAKIPKSANNSKEVLQLKLIA